MICTIWLLIKVFGPDWIGTLPSWELGTLQLYSSVYNKWLLNKYQ